MKRISSCFEYRDLKSVEARLLKHQARLDVLRRCRLLGVQSPVISFDCKQIRGHSRLRGEDVAFECEAYAEIPGN